MFKEKDILLTEANKKQKAKIQKTKMNPIQNALNKARNINTPKSTKTSKYLNIIIVIATLVILFIAFILIIIKAIRTTKHKISYKNLIPVAFSLNDNYTYPLIVLLTSILYNSAPDTFYVFYLLLNPDLSDKKIKKILGVKEKYPNCNIEIIHMGNKYSNYPHDYNKSVAVYYKLELSDLITDFDKIIYLDVDTIVHKDLTEMYNLEMGKYYYLGFPDHDITNYQLNGKNNYINTGVLLVNLRDLRKVNATLLFQNYYNSHNTLKVDEYLINSVFSDKISFLPFIYGIPDFGAGSNITVSPSNFCKEFQNFVNCSEIDMENSSKNRIITHNCYEVIKWWNKNYTNLTDIGKKWLFYASKSNVFVDICKNYNQFGTQCEKIVKENK